MSLNAKNPGGMIHRPQFFSTQKSSFPVEKPKQRSAVQKSFGIYKKDLTLQLDILTTHCVKTVYWISLIKAM